VFRRQRYCKISIRYIYFLQWFHHKAGIVWTHARFVSLLCLLACYMWNSKTSILYVGMFRPIGTWVDFSGETATWRTKASSSSHPTQWMNAKILAQACTLYIFSTPKRAIHSSRVHRKSSLQCTELLWRIPLIHLVLSSGTCILILQMYYWQPQHTYTLWAQSLKNMNVHVIRIT
jgi:hypothetical protein